jgi:SUR7/PalI family
MNENLTVYTDKFDISKQISGELEVGPLHLNLSDIDWPSDIQDGLNKLNTALDATFVLYAIGIAAAGCAIIAALVALFLHGSRLISLGNWGLTSLSFVAFLVASIIITIVQIKAVNLINKYGNDIGVFAYKGTKYLILTWVAMAVMFLASMAWVGEFCVGKRNTRREYTEKPTRSGWRHRGSDEAALHRRAGV